MKVVSGSLDVLETVGKKKHIEYDDEHLSIHTDGTGQRGNTLLSV